MIRRGSGDGERRLLPPGGVTGPMPWIVAAMMFLTVLAAAASLGLAYLASSLGSGRALSVEIVSADGGAKARGAARVLDIVGRTPGLEKARLVPEGEVAESLRPWLGDVTAADIPLPAIVEAENNAGADLKALETRLKAAVPSARLSTSAEWLAPLAGFIAALRWLAAGILLIVALASVAVVTLAARATLDTQGEMIELLHLIGATDGQIARLVQRRIAGDALLGSVIGGGGAFLLLIFLGERLAALGSDLLGGMSAPGADWWLLLLIPPLGALLAMLVARHAVFRALKRFP